MFKDRKQAQAWDTSSWIISTREQVLRNKDVARGQQESRWEDSVDQVKEAWI